MEYKSDLSIPMKLYYDT
uniref:Uncharacterized protein n=1 Tax=Amphimedon queenslandica TaxID=400682 RepID=A0A1X7V8N2_AMPQE